jgi:hypothetical protein
VIGNDLNIVVPLLNLTVIVVMPILAHRDIFGAALKMFSDQMVSKLKI